MLLSGAMGVGKAQAFSFPLGGNKLLMDGYSYLYYDATSPESTTLRGVFGIDAIKTWDPATGAVSDFDWFDEDNPEYLSIRFGGLDIAGDGFFTGGWAELWLNDFNPLETEGVDETTSDAYAGPGTGYDKTDFGLVMTGGVKLLDLIFASGAFPLNPDATFAFTPFPNGGAYTYGYMDVIGGLLEDQFDSDFFAINNEFFDVALEGSNAGANYNGWNYTGASYSAYANVVPEPGTLLLLGAGMLGLAACARKRRQN